MKSSKWLLVLLVAVAIGTGIYFHQQYRIAPNLHFEQLECTDLQGQSVAAAQYHGRKLLVCFFATWCGPCLHEISLLEKLQTQLQHAGVEVVLVTDEPAPRLLAFQSRQHITFPIWRTEQSLHALGVMTYPTTYLLNADGEVVFKKVDFTDWSDPQWLQKLLD